LALPFVIRGAQVDALAIARFLVVLLLLPFFAGVFVKARRAEFARRLRPVMDRISGVAMLLMLAFVLVIHFGSVLKLFHTGAIAAGLLFSLLTALTGWLLGGKNHDHRIVLALGTSIRNIPAALLVGARNFDAPEVLVMILATTLSGSFLLAPAARFVGRHRTTLPRPILEDTDRDQNSP
jgi:predicted Na+-dependent transporter